MSVYQDVIFLLFFYDLKSLLFSFKGRLISQTEKCIPITSSQSLSSSSLCF